MRVLLTGLRQRSAFGSEPVLRHRPKLSRNSNARCGSDFCVAVARKTGRRPAVKRNLNRGVRTCLTRGLSIESEAGSRETSNQPSRNWAARSGSLPSRDHKPRTELAKSKRTRPLA